MPGVRNVPVELGIGIHFAGYGPHSVDFVRTLMTLSINC
jgi:hypothetical protein